MFEKKYNAFHICRCKDRKEILDYQVKGNTFKEAPNLYCAECSCKLIVKMEKIDV